MTKQALKYISNIMKELKVPYEFMIWSKELSFPFFVGEFTETDNEKEDGMMSSTFIITGTTDGTYLQLLDVKDKIKNYFTNEGLTAIFDDGCGVAISYSNSFPVPTGENGLKRIQINLQIIEWSV